MSDPLRWWPGKYGECRRIAALVEDLPGATVLQYGGLPVFTELLPDHPVHHERLRSESDANGLWIPPLPFPDDHFDVGVSARVIELLPPALRGRYLRELLRVCRLVVYVAMPLQPELEIIDKVKNHYVWDAHRYWAYRGVGVTELEDYLRDLDVSIEYHSEPECAAWLSNVPTDTPGSFADGARELRHLDTISPPYRVAEILKSIRSVSFATPAIVQ